MAKKDPYRFSLRFNPKDPRHREISEILNMQGRGAANLIVNAVTHYIHCTNQVSALTDKEDIFMQKFRQLLEDVLEEKLQNLEISNVPQSPVNDSGLDSEELQSIAECLDFFN